MWHGMRRCALAAATMLAGLAGVAAHAPGASAAITPTVTPASTAPVTAGSTGNLGLDLRFAPTGSDSPDAVTLNLPPGVLANASIDNGQCLKTADISDPTCQIGSGTVTALAEGTIPITTNVNFYLVPPPSPGDLAGLAVADATGDQIGATNGIAIRPSGNPDGVGVTLDLTLPNNLFGVPISISDISSTFTGVRFPATCPSTPANITLSADSYADPTTKTASAPLPVSGCAALPYAPRFSVSATRDSGDKQVTLATTITQAADESPNASVSLTFPGAVLQPPISALGSLCGAGVASGRCTPVGSATAASPDYPTPLTGQAYLTGSLNGLTLTLVFPPPFPLTLVGAVDLAKNATTFTGLPDIPLTSLTVTLNGGPKGLFGSRCNPSSGTATAALVDQNGDKSAKLPTPFTVAGCPTSAGGGGTSGGHGGSSAHRATARPHLSSVRIRGLKRRRPSLMFTLTAGHRAPKLHALTVELPRGLSLHRQRVHRRLRLTGISLRGAKLRSAVVSHRHLVITLRKPVRSVSVTVTSAALTESAALKARASARTRAKRLKRLELIVITRDARGKRTTIRAAVKNLGL